MIKKPACSILARLWEGEHLVDGNPLESYAAFERQVGEAELCSTTGRCLMIVAIFLCLIGYNMSDHTTEQWIFGPYDTYSMFSGLIGVCFFVKSEIVKDRSLTNWINFVEGVKGLERAIDGLHPDELWLKNQARANLLATAGIIEDARRRTQPKEESEISEVFDYHHRLFCMFGLVEPDAMVYFSSAVLHM